MTTAGSERLERGAASKRENTLCLAQDKEGSRSGAQGESETRGTERKEMKRLREKNPGRGPERIARHSGGSVQEGDKDSHVCMAVYVCVCVRARARERARERVKRERNTAKISLQRRKHLFFSPHFCFSFRCALFSAAAAASTAPPLQLSLQWRTSHRKEREREPIELFFVSRHPFSSVMFPFVSVSPPALPLPSRAHPPRPRDHAHCCRLCALCAIAG